MNQTLQEIVTGAQKLLIIQAENPDGDSLGSALALEQIFGAMGKDAYMYCPVDMPKHLRYFTGWDRVTQEFPNQFDASFIVDTSSLSLLEKALANGSRAKLTKKPIVFIDHHNTDSEIDFEHLMLCDPQKVATAEIIYDLAKQHTWPIDSESGRSIVAAIMSDSLGLVSEKTTSDTVHAVAEIMQQHAVSLSEIDVARRSYGKKSREILTYKGKLLQRITFELDGRLALLSIPEPEINQYSDAYNPAVLALEDLRSVEGVELSIILKVYNNRITGKLRSNDGAKICDKIAEKFGGGGHPYAAGFRTSDWSQDDLRIELIKVTRTLLEDEAV